MTRRAASQAEHRLWLVDQQGPRGVEFSFPYLFDLHGPCDTDRLLGAFGQVAARHSTLRTTFALDGDTLLGEAHPVGDLDMAVVDCPPGDIDDMVGDEIATPFDLARDCPLRVQLYRLGTEHHRLLCNVHHIATDGRSMQLMLDEVAASYADTGLPELGVPEPMRAPDGAVVSYWRDVVADPPDSVTLPGAREPRRLPSFAGRWLDRELSPADVAGLEGLARDAGSSLYSVLLGFLVVTLGRRCGTDDVLLGVPFSGRAPGAERLIGFFVNLLPVRLRFTERLTFRQLIAAATDAVTGALEHSEVPLDQVLDLVPRPDGGLGRLLNVTLTEEDAPRLELPGIAVTPLDVRLDVARYHLAVDYRRLESGAIRFEMSYAKDELSCADVAEVFDDLAALARAAVAGPDTRLLDLPTTTGPVSLLAESNTSPTAVSLAGCWSDVLANSGDRIAVTDSAGSLTFAELDRLSAGLVGRLPGVGRGSVVALACGRSRDFVIGLLAVLRCGATAVLLDAGHPKARLTQLVEQSGAVVTLCSADGVVDGRTVVVSTAQGVNSTPWADRDAETLAYHVFTSGSTGTPKCVGITDGNVLRLLANLTALGMAEPGGRIALNASFGFDASVQQWVRLFAGCQLVILDEETRLDPADLVRRVVTEQVEELDISPRHLDAVLDLLLEALRGAGWRLRVLIGGEAVPPSLWSQLRAAVDDGSLVCWNMYGPAEATVDSTVYPIALAPMPTIGVPLPGVRGYVLDSWLRPVSKGSPGFLYLAGEGVGRGYLGAPGATARVFVADPIAGDGRRMYATGDRVRVDRRGRLEYLGRADDQVKINGHRVELGEVEAAVRAHPDVSGCSVLADESEALHLFVVGADGTLADWLAGRLPSFMVPRKITQVPAIPLLPSGKVDRRRLLAAVEAEPTVEQSSSEVADLIADVWRDVLRRPDITAADDFFSLGGHSLLAIRVVARVRREMNLSLPISSIFEFPVLSDLADHVEQLRHGHDGG